MITRRKLLGATALTGAWLAAGSMTASAGAVGRRSIVDELSWFVADQAARGLFSGTVRLDYRGCPVYSAAYGLANRTTGIANTAATRFSAASVGKFLTGVTAARVVQNGQLAFGATLGEVMPQLRNPALRPLTLHQLLTHTAALPEVNPGPPPGTPTGRAVDYLPELENLQLIGTPGQRWAYSNAGFLAAAIMIEQAGHRPYAAALHADVLVPARMHDSQASQPPAGDPRIATRYTPDGQTFPPDYPSGAGGLYTTASDLVSFAHALMRHRLLDAAHTAEVITGKVPTGHGDLYAYGCSNLTVAGHPIIWHNGGAPGASAWLQIYPDDGYTLAALSNVAEPRPGGLGVQPIIDKAQHLVTGTG
jgi:CubicO group peptidase (beta-lactamase class C family)